MRPVQLYLGTGHHRCAILPRRARADVGPYGAHHNVIQVDRVPASVRSDVVAFFGHKEFLAQLQIVAGSDRPLRWRFDWSELGRA